LLEENGNKKQHEPVLSGEIVLLRKDVVKGLTAQKQEYSSVLF
jgi:hypothetical protein